MPVLSGFTVKAKVKSLVPVEAVHSPGLGGAVVVGASGGDGASDGDVGSGGGAVAHPTRIMLTTVTTVNKGMINFFIFASSVLGHR